MKTKTISFILVVCLLIVSLSYFALAEPNGVSVQLGTSENQGSVAAGQDDNAIAGNVTELNITSISTTQSWQGYHGNVTGVITLEDANNNVLYNWTLDSPSGEIFASNGSSIAWAGLSCYNSSDPNNITFFESMFGILGGDSDGINETFTQANHPNFFANSIQFTSGQCNNTKLYDSAGQGAFDEVLLIDGPNLVFTSILVKDQDGFDGVTHDFQMIVLEDGHGSDTDPTTYYFWAELD